MCWIFKKARMMHPPRTAGHWIVGASRNAGMQVYQWGPKHSFLEDSCGEDMPTFCVVRDPVEWYRSYFGYKNTPDANWGAKHQPWSRFDARGRAGDINLFVKRICKWRPGFYSKAIAKYVDGNVRVCRYKNMVEDVIRALKWAGEEFDENIFRQTKKLNVSAKKNQNKKNAGNPHFMEMSDETVMTIRKYESAFYERFGNEF